MAHVIFIYRRKYPEEIDLLKTKIRYPRFLYRYRPINKNNLDALRTNNSLIKKECHKYDEEWRMIANVKMNLPATVEWIPFGVIIGLRTSPADKDSILSMAKEAGIKNIYQSYIDAENMLNAYPI